MLLCGCASTHEDAAEAMAGALKWSRRSPMNELQWKLAASYSFDNPHQLKQFVTLAGKWEIRDGKLMAVDGEHGFNAEEWELLQKESRKVIDAIIALPKDHWWECSALAELLQARVWKLNNVINDSYEIYYHPGSKEDLSAYYNYSQQVLAQVNSILRNIYKLVCDEFAHTLKNNNLVQVIVLAEKLDEQFNNLQNFHVDLFKHSLPQEEPCPEMQQIMISITPFIVKQMQQIILELNDRGPLSRHYPYLDLQVSLFPTSIPVYLSLQSSILQKL